MQASVRFATAFILGMTLSGCSAPAPPVGKQDEKEDPPVEAVGPVLAKVDARDYRWGDPARWSEGRMVLDGGQIVFDNGTPLKLLVKIAEAARFEVPPGDHAILTSEPGALTFAVSEDGSSWQSWTCEIGRDEREWVYNHRAAWDYGFEYVTYTNEKFAYDPGGSYDLRGETLFRANIQYFFQDPPPRAVAYVEREGDPATIISGVLRREGQPHLDRKLRHFRSPDDQPGIVVDLGMHERRHRFSVQYPFRPEEVTGERLTQGPARVEIYNATLAPMTILVDGQELGPAPRYQFVDLFVEPGRRTLQLRKANGEFAIEVTEELFSNKRYDFDDLGLRAN